jgi:hypothetical protein
VCQLTGKSHDLEFDPFTPFNTDDGHGGGDGDAYEGGGGGRSRTYDDEEYEDDYYEQHQESYFQKTFVSETISDPCTIETPTKKPDKKRQKTDRHHNTTPSVSNDHHPLNTETQSGSLSMIASTLNQLQLVSTTTQSSSSSSSSSSNTTATTRTPKPTHRPKKRGQTISALATALIEKKNKATEIVRHMLGRQGIHPNQEAFDYASVVDKTILYMWKEVCSTECYQKSSQSYPFITHCVIMIMFMIDGFPFTDPETRKLYYIISKRQDIHDKLANKTMNAIKLGPSAEGKKISDKVRRKASEFFRGCIKEIISDVRRGRQILQKLVERAQTLPSSMA